MPRLNQERQSKLEPKRMETALTELKKLGFWIEYQNETTIKFRFNGNLITFFPYSGWHSGKGIQDGRGLKNLLKQLTN